jgi:hypothetical protein
MQEKTGSYNEAVLGINIAVIHKCHPEVKLDQAQVDLIQGTILAAVDVNTSGKAPSSF